MLSSTLTVLVLTIVVSALVAVVIQGIVVLLGRMAQAPPVPARAPGPPARVTVEGIPAHHLIAIAAACDTVLGQHRIVHIESSRPDSSWVAVGRQMHHGSHRITRHTPRP